MIPVDLNRLREALAIRCDCDFGNVPDGYGGQDQCPKCSSTLFRPITDAELASLGYVRLDGTDVALLEEGLHRLGPGHHESENVVYQLGMRVLAAIDQEHTDAD